MAAGIGNIFLRVFRHVIGCVLQQNYPTAASAGGHVIQYQPIPPQVCLFTFSGQFMYHRSYIYKYTHFQTFLFYSNLYIDRVMQLSWQLQRLFKIVARIFRPSCRWKNKKTSAISYLSVLREFFSCIILLSHFFKLCLCGRVDFQCKLVE